MREVFSVHEPLLVNTLGHCAGTLIFTIFLVLLLRDRLGKSLRESRLTLLAAVLALLWNFASLLVIAWGDPSGDASQWLVAVSSSALSLLPAVLLHLSLAGRFRPVVWAGYGLGLAAASMHTSEKFLHLPHWHETALRVTTFGFGALTLAAALTLLRSPGDRKTLTTRLVGTMSLFLFALSFVHFGESEAHSWAGELLAHHAGIALALFVLLQDYRFVLLDAFVRFLANVFFAALFVFALANAVSLPELSRWMEGDPFREGLVLAGSCLLLLAFSFLRRHLAGALERLVFPRHDLDSLLEGIAAKAAGGMDEEAFLAACAGDIAAHFEAPLVTSGGSAVHRLALGSHLPAPAADLQGLDRERIEGLLAEVILPIHLSADAGCAILLGRRGGGRRYLSDDLTALGRIQVEMEAQLDRRREAEMRRLVSQAEMRALQAQIHPHFLFNALNTLYGIIPREAAGARRTVLNLADIFRYFLQTDRTVIPLEKELEIVRAYLEIESLRLGGKLRTEMNIDPAVLRIAIPVLTVEPLVENAVKHGVANRAEGGLVRLDASIANGCLRVCVSDTGPGFREGKTGGAGVGMDNVLKRLRLCYGPQANIEVHSSEEGASVAFLVPVRMPEAVLP
ncbi:MAG: histidine kinase [Bryobacterales bacterium]|nr:histidine kinase [Bryobacterales bacterium]